ncbi:MAG TPA: hypothetical protein VIM61_12760 [Chthoniobacterales bacterium]|jgi:hypothetical protein
MNPSPETPDIPFEKRVDSDALDHATETQRAVREGRRHSGQSMQHESDDAKHSHRQPDMPWQID